MVEGKVIKFGYGTVSVGSNYQGQVTFRSIKPPQEVGSGIVYNRDIEFFNDMISIDMLKNYHILKSQLENLQSPAIIVIDEYTLDFSNFNRKSVEVVLDHAYSAYYNYLRLCAC